VFGRDLEGADVAVLERRDKARAGERDLVEPIGTVYHPDRLGTEILQHLGERLHPLPREYAHHLPLDASGIGQGTQQVEDGAGGELDARGTDILHRRVMRRREHEADPGFAHTTTDLLGLQVDPDAKRGEYVGGPRTR